jgi:calcium-dependent protein kinase
MRKDKWDRLSQDAQGFVKALIEKDPNVRLTAQEALEHPWLRCGANDDVTFEPTQSMVLAFQKYHETPKFRRCCFNAMAWLLPNNETAKLREEFLAMDTDRQGTISLKELKTIMVQKFKIAENDVVSIFNSLDANHDQEIHYSEFLAAMLSSRIELNDKLLGDAFRNFDKDLTGYITPANLKESFGEVYDGVCVDTLIKEADSFKHGKISYPEFAAYVRGKPLDIDDARIPPSVSPVRPVKKLKIPKRSVSPEILEQADAAAPPACCSIM